MLPSLLGNKKKKNYCHVPLLEMYNIIKAGRIHHCFYMFAFDLSIFWGDFCILIAQNRRNYGITGELSAFVPSLKSFHGGWWVVYTSGMDLKSQCVTCFHAWKQPAWFATSQPQESLPAASSPQLPGLSQQHGIHPNKASRRLFGWQTMKDELILLPTPEEVLPRWKGKKMPCKGGEKTKSDSGKAGLMNCQNLIRG